MASAQDKIASTEPFILPTRPGVKRDGTQLDGDYWVDGQWERFQRGRPRKIGGRRLLNHDLSGPVRKLLMSSKNALNYVHSGYPQGLEQLTVALGSGTSSPQDRTPAAFAGSADNLWSMDIMFDTNGSTNRLLAHAATNMTIDQETETALYTGELTAAGALVSTGDVNAVASGGVCVLHPYTFLFGNAGTARWSRSGLPRDFTGAGSGLARITGQKIVAGRATRGGGAPAGLFWSLDALIRGVFVGGTTVWDFDTISTESSILSQNGVVEYDGIFYWPGTDRFLMYNGRVQDLPNPMNRNWFFDNLNFTYRQKVWGMKVPAFKEIWWFYPRGSATECSHYIILNMEGGQDPRTWYWYDGALARSAGFYSQVFPYPIMADLTADANGKYGLWQHEFGVDEIGANGVTLAIQSYIESGDLSPILGNRGKNEPLRNQMNRLAEIGVEHDIVQTGNMTLTVRGRRFPRSSDSDKTFTFSPTAEYTSMGEMRAYMRLRWESNVVGGNYQFGENVLHQGLGDRRR